MEMEFTLDTGPARNEGLFFLVQLDGSGVDAVALPCGLGTIFENVPQVSAALAASHLGTLHSIAGVVVFGDVFFGVWLPKAWPTAARVILLF